MYHIKLFINFNRSIFGNDYDTLSCILFQHEGSNGDTVKDPESIHMCDTCGKELSSIRALAKHKKWHEDQGRVDFLVFYQFLLF